MCEPGPFPNSSSASVLFPAISQPVHALCRKIIILFVQERTFLAKKIA